MVTVDGFDFPEDLFYLGGGTDQLWIKKENGKVRLGMTSLGSYAAGKIKFIRLRPPGNEVKAGRRVGTLESGKWTGAVSVLLGRWLCYLAIFLTLCPGTLTYKQVREYRLF